MKQTTEKLIIFYDDTKKSCRDCIREFEAYGYVECRRVSDYQKKTMIYATEAKIGLVFEGEDGKVPDSVLHVIRRLIADKKENHMLLVTGGRREFKAIKTAREEMNQRGYSVSNIYSRYLLQKHKLKQDAAVNWILYELSEGQETVSPREKYRDMDKKELRQHLRQEIKAYRSYQKQQKGERLL